MPVHATSGTTLITRKNPGLRPVLGQTPQMPCSAQRSAAQPTACPLLVDAVRRPTPVGRGPCVPPSTSSRRQTPPRRHRLLPLEQPICPVDRSTIASWTIAPHLRSAPVPTDTSSTPAFQPTSIIAPARKRRTISAAVVLARSALPTHGGPWCVDGNEEGRIRLLRSLIRRFVIPIHDHPFDRGPGRSVRVSTRGGTPSTSSSFPFTITSRCTCAQCPDRTILRLRARDPPCRLVSPLCLRTVPSSLRMYRATHSTKIG